MAAAFYRLWAMSLQAGFLILIVFIVRAFLGRYPRTYSYCLWLLAGIRLLCPLWVESPFSLQPDLSGYSTAAPEEQQGSVQLSKETDDMQPELETAMGEGEVWAETPKEGQETLAPEQTEQFQKGGEQSPQKESASFSLKQWVETAQRNFGGNRQENSLLSRLLLILYPLGVAVLMLFYLGQYIWMRCKVSTAVWDKGNVWLSDRIASPFVMGVIFPRIYLPYQLKGAEKKYVLRHERTHIKHQDPLIRVLGSLCVCLHWWNPLVWIAVYLMNQDMEMFCDETVLRSATLEERKDYARTLLAFAERRSSFGTGLAFGESHTEKRVKNIMKRRKRSLWIVCLVVAVAVFCVVALLTVPRGGARGDDMNGIGDDQRISGSQSGEEPADSEGEANGENIEASQIGGSENAYLSEEDMAYLMKMCPAIQDFSNEEDMDREFWEYFLFAVYTSDFEREQVNRETQQYGQMPYIRVDADEVEETIRGLFGKNLSEYGMSLETLGSDNDNLVYENGYLYVSASDSPAFVFTPYHVTTTDTLIEVTLIKALEDEPVSQVILYLLPAENERGFRLDGKEEGSVPAEWLDSSSAEGQILEGQEFEVDMNPYGQVTFAAYAPDLSLSPYADATFKLLQDGGEIYSFPLKGTGVREDEAVFRGMEAMAFPDLNGDGYTDVVTIAYYEHADGLLLSQARIFTYNQGGYFLEENYLEEAYNRSHEDKTIADIEAFAARSENRDYYVRTSIYGRWKITGFELPGVYALAQDEIDQYAGARLEYGVTSLWTSTGGESQMVGSYEKSMVTMEELGQDFGINVNNLELEVNELVSFQVEAEGESLFGHFFYLTDPDHALIYYEGVFFEAERE